MSSNIDPAKLKVIDLRNELSSRGLDTKGNKAVLVKRLKTALEKEFDKDLPDTSIADTSTEDLDTSQIEESPKKNDEAPSEKVETNVDKDDPKREVTLEKTKTLDTPKPEVKSSQKTSGEQKSGAKTESPEKDMKLVEKPKVDTKSVEVKPKPAAANKIEKVEETANSLVKIKTPEKAQEKLKSPEKIKPEENPENVEEKMETDTSETKDGDKSTSSKIESVSPLEKVDKEKDNKEASDETSQKLENPPEKMEIGEEEAKMKESKSTNGSEQKGEKRKRSSDSPQRSQRRRSRSPVRENEPDIDNSIVQLSWYDSDLHLQIDDKTFLSAKPMTDGVFGYAWAGVRGTYGVQTGKVFYELKLTEEIKWEDDFSKQPEKKNHNKRNSNKKNAGNKTSDLEKAGKNVESNTKEEKMEETSAVTNEKKAEEKKSVDATKEKEGGTESEGNSADKCEDTESNEETAQESKEEVAQESKEETAQESKEEPAQEAKADEKMETDEVKSENAESDVKEKDDKIELADKPVEISEPIPSHVLRVGWSLLNCSLQLGEEKFSYGYESSGRFVTDKKFVDYGIKFGAGDVVGTFLDIDGDNVTIRYAVNGVIQPVAMTVLKSDLPENPVFFPHVLSRNYAFELNLDDKKEPWFPVPADLAGFQCLGKVEEKVAGPTRPESRGDCEVLLMCGLPAAGKTHWVTEHVTSNPDKRYCVLGKNNMLEKMTVSGEPLKSKYTGKWSFLMDRMQKCLNRLVALAAHRRRNYIIDQTNVFPSAQRRKMRPFEGFKRKAVVIVVGDEEHARRQSLQEATEGKEVPDSTILEMKAAMILPDKGDWIDEVIYAGVDESEAKEIVKKYNEKGKEAGYGTEKKFKDDRWQHRRNDYRSRNYRDRSSFHSQRYEPRGRWVAPRPRGGGWNRERQDTRGPPAREWRGGSRDYHGARGNYNQGGYTRDHNSSRSRDHGPVHGQGGGRGQGRGQSWSGGWGGQGYNQQSSYGGRSGYSNPNWGSGGGNQWKYSSGSGGGNNQHGHGSYGSNWNYYGQYSQNWNQK
nr:heterogeneous nuclear ribonucleoprotein U-like protein 2 [Leptinotarsa decemlineata]